MTGIIGNIFVASLLLVVLPLILKGYKRIAATIIFIGGTSLLLAGIKSIKAWIIFNLIQLLFLLLASIGQMLKNSSKKSWKIFFQSLVPGQLTTFEEISQLYIFDEKLKISVWASAKYIFYITAFLSAFFSMVLPIGNRLVKLQIIMGNFLPILFPILVAIIIDHFLLNLLHGKLFRKLDLSGEHLKTTTTHKWLWSVPAVLLLLLYWPYVSYIFSDLTYSIQDLYKSLPDII